MLQIYVDRRKLFINGDQYHWITCFFSSCILIAGKMFVATFFCTIFLRLLQAFVGVLKKKMQMHAVFKVTPTNYISIERL